MNEAVSNPSGTDGEVTKQGFQPIGKASARILVLGSMPGEDSLARGQYYAHPRNGFWKIMAALNGVSAPQGYSQRVALLDQLGIAVWDVIESCQRPGSLDTRIVSASVQVNDFAGFFARYQRVSRILFNGARAEQEYRRRVLPDLPARLRGLPQRRLPSTSPAMAALSFEEKLARWGNAVGGG